MEAKHLMQLAVILEKGSITAAAEHLLLTQPTLTRNMHTLEMQAGGKLFSRSRFGVRSTPMGENLAREGRAIARQIETARETAARYRLGFHDQLKIGTGPLIGMAMIPVLCEQLTKAHPDIALTIYSDRPQFLLEQMVDGNYDIVLSPAIDSHVPQGFSRRLLTEDALGIFCGINHPLAQKESTQPAELEACEWMVIGTRSPFQNIEREFLTQTGLQRVSTQFATVNDAVILLTVLTQGRHLAVLPRIPAKLMQQTYPLVELPLAVPRSERNLYLWYRETLTENSAVRTFKTLAQDIVSTVN